MRYLLLIGIAQLISGGGPRSTTITHEERCGDQLYLFQNLPAQVCTRGGEIWIEEKTLQEIDLLIREGEPTHKVETLVYDCLRRLRELTQAGAAA